MFSVCGHEDVRCDVIVYVNNQIYRGCMTRLASPAFTKNPVFTVPVHLVGFRLSLTNVLCHEGTNLPYMPIFRAFVPEQINYPWLLSSSSKFVVTAFMNKFALATFMNKKLTLYSQRKGSLPRLYLRSNRFSVPYLSVRGTRWRSG
jgi:hypothetical protein